MEKRFDNDEGINYIKKIEHVYCKKLLKDDEKIQNIISTLPISISYTLQHIFESYKTGKPSKCQILNLSFINDCLNDEFNIGCWRDIDINTRSAFTISTCLKILIELQNHEELLNENNVKSMIKTVDMGLLLGAPILDESDESILSNMGTDLMEYFNKFINCSSNELHYLDTRVRSETTRENESFFDNCNEILSVAKPDLAYFYEHYFKPNVPVKLLDCIDHWPAKTKWQNFEYFIEVAGERTVPIEIGSHYADVNWSQKLMTIREFVTNYVCKEHELGDNRGYLAQHTLFDQLPKLRDDILIPDYCALSDDNESPVDPEINAWFGPKGTVSPLHYDPKHNILTQVIGSKQIILISPDDSKYLYPYDDKLLFNTSQVDPTTPNLIDYPDFAKATKWKCLLKPGEMLYIPPKWWHYVISIEKSFSVSFWWN